MALVDLTDDEIETLLEPFSETRVLDVDEDEYVAIRKLKDALAGNTLDEELTERSGPLPRLAIGDSASQWFVELMLAQEPLPVSDEDNFQRLVVQHAQNAMSKLAESTRHAHPDNRDRVIKDAGLLGLFAMCIARAAMEARDWPIPVNADA